MVCIFERVIMQVCPSEEADLSLLAGLSLMELTAPRMRSLFRRYLRDRLWNKLLSKPAGTVSHL